MGYSIIQSLVFVSPDSVSLLSFAGGIATKKKKKKIGTKNTHLICLTLADKALYQLISGLRFWPEQTEQIVPHQTQDIHYVKYDCML